MKTDVASKPINSTNLLVNQSKLDSSTIDMQKMLLQKQQELLELQQKKLKLELLQTQVKLQEQLSGKLSTDKIVGEPQVSFTASSVLKYVILYIIIKND